MFTAVAYPSAKTCHTKNAWVNDKVHLDTPGEAKNWGVLGLITELSQPGNLDWTL